MESLVWGCHGHRSSYSSTNLLLAQGKDRVWISRQGHPISSSDLYNVKYCLLPSYPHRDCEEYEILEGHMFLSPPIPLPGPPHPQESRGCTRSI